LFSVVYTNYSFLIGWNIYVLKQWLVTENARAQWVKYTSLLVNTKKLLEHNTGPASEHSVQLKAPGYLHVYLLLILFGLHFKVLLICMIFYSNFHLV